jgi:hypothetical protein
MLSMRKYLEIHFLADRGKSGGCRQKEARAHLPSRPAFRAPEEPRRRQPGAKPNGAARTIAALGPPSPRVAGARNFWKALEGFGMLRKAIGKHRK